MLSTTKILLFIMSLKVTMLINLKLSISEKMSCQSGLQVHRTNFDGTFKNIYHYTNNILIYSSTATLYLKHINLPCIRNYFSYVRKKYFTIKSSLSIIFLYVFIFFDNTTQNYVLLFLYNLLFIKTIAFLFVLCATFL